VPGQPDQSLLLKAVRHAEKDLRMPPRKTGSKLADPDILHRGFGERLLGRLELGRPTKITAGRGRVMEKQKTNSPSDRNRLKWSLGTGSFNGHASGITGHTHVTGGDGEALNPN